MKRATYLLVLAGALCACGRDDTSTHAAGRGNVKDTARGTGSAVEPTANDSTVARTPVAPELQRPTEPPPITKDTVAKDIDTRPTDPVGTDATIVDGQKKTDAGQSDALTPPGLPNPHATPGDTTGAAGAGATPGASGTTTAGTKPATAALGTMDTEFITKAVIGGLFEVQSSELAVSQATTPFVKDFAQMMVLDHGDANSELETIVRGKGATLPKDLDEDHQTRLAHLRDQKGVDFDREYREQQTTAHKDAIALFDRAASTCEDPELKAFAAKLLPKLREHQQKLNEMPPTQG